MDTIHMAYLNYIHDMVPMDFPYTFPISVAARQPLSPAGQETCRVDLGQGTVSRNADICGECALRTRAVNLECGGWIP